MKHKRLLFYSITSAVLLITTVLSLILPFQITLDAKQGFLSLSLSGSQAAELSDWTIKFEPSGTSFEDGTLYIRLDFYPSETSKIYNECYVNVPVIPKEGYQGKIGMASTPEERKAYQDWLDSLPRIWQLNPAICVFMAVPPDVTVQQLSDFTALKYNATTIATLEDSLFKTDSAHTISPYMRDKTALTEAKYQVSDKQALITAVNERLGGLAITGADISIPQKIIPESIDMGSAASNYFYSTSAAYTTIDTANPANATGTLNTFQYYLDIAATAGKCGSAYLVSGTTYKCRASYSTGSIAAGSVITQTGKSVAVTLGDIIIFYSADGTPDVNDTGGAGIAGEVSGEYADANDQAAYTTYAGYRMAVYATGTESGGAPAITNTPATRAFGTLYNSQTYYSNNLTLGYAPTFALADAQCYFTITNSGTASGNISAKATNFTGGTTLSLTDAAPGATTLRLSLYKSGDANSSANITLTTTDRLFITSLAASATKKWEIRLETPTSDQNDANQKTCTITFTISSP